MHRSSGKKINTIFREMDTANESCGIKKVTSKSEIPYLIVYLN
jgi:hypothetical protein